MTIVGIDLGTTNSAVAAVRDGAPSLFDNPLGDVLTPSVVAADKRRGSLLVGRTAKDIIAGEPHLGASQFKRAMGTDQVFELAGRRLDAVELSAHVLDALRADAERALGVTVERAVISVPAYFNDAQRFATKRAAEIAGLAVERIINEPTAAAIAYGLERRDDASRFLVFDLGGGTFDVCVMELFEGLLAVESVAGISRLGGEDFTAALVDHVCDRAGIDATRLRAEKRPVAAALYRRCELLKRKLSRWPTSTVSVDAVFGVAAAELEVSTAEADQVFEPLIARLLGPCRSALRGAVCKPADLDEVVLVGGATRMPAVRRFVEELFGRPPLVELDPDKVVAQGAAIQAALCADDRSVGDIVVTDINAHSLGVDSTRIVADRKVDGFFVPIIHRNTVLPTSRSDVFSPIEPYQTSMTFAIYEGESRRVEDNTRIGELQIDKLPAKDGRVLVTFTYGVDGILEVEARALANERTVSKILTRTGEQLSGEALDRARSRLRTIRSGPTERPSYKDLLVRASLLWKEADPAVREILGHLIDRFEAALASREPPAIAETFAALGELCDRLDDGDRW
jgi:molecular chaperone HscC